MICFYTQYLGKEANYVSVGWKRFVKRDCSERNYCIVDEKN